MNFFEQYRAAIPPHLYLPAPLTGSKFSSFGQQTMTGSYAQNVENHGKMFFGGGRYDDEYDMEAEERATITIPVSEFKKLKRAYKRWDRLPSKLQNFLDHNDPQNITINTSISSE